jgi:4-hydroxybenzoate polyprenyltransferase
VETALRLGVAMLGIQFSIGALNDVVDAAQDAIEKPRKPIPSGFVDRRVAVAIAVVGGALGVGLSAISGWSTALAAVGCAGLGYVYDLRLSRTVLSWLPLSLALPLLPMHAWLGATGNLPPGLIALVPVGVVGGAGLALANGLVDVERDKRSGRSSATVALGRGRTWLLQTAALGLAVALAFLVAPGGSTPATAAVGLLRDVRAGGIGFGAVLVGVGAACLAAGRPAVRERGWELEALGVAAIGIGWIAGVAAANGAIGV